MFESLTDCTVPCCVTIVVNLPSWPLTVNSPWIPAPPKPRGSNGKCFALWGDGVAGAVVPGDAVLVGEGSVAEGTAWPAAQTAATPPPLNTTAILPAMRALRRPGVMVDMAES